MEHTVASVSVVSEWDILNGTSAFTCCLEGEDPKLTEGITGLSVPFNGLWIIPLQSSISWVRSGGPKSEWGKEEMMTYTKCIHHRKW